MPGPLGRGKSSSMTYEAIFRIAAVLAPLFALALALALDAVAPSTSWVSGAGHLLALSPIYGGVPYFAGLAFLLGFYLRGKPVSSYHRVSLVSPILLAISG